MYEIAKVLLILSHFVFINGVGITCYECYPTRENRGRGILPCTEFDWSSKFQTECPKSTLCFKRTYTVPLGTGKEIHSVERGCAPQKVEGQDYNRAEKKWYRTETIVESVYEEGCSMAEDNGRPGPPAEYCYCSSWLCNRSSSFREISISLIVFNLFGTLLCMWQR